MFLELKNITKKFLSITALNNVSISFKKGEVHAIVGENGAGKSTLIKIIAGIYNADNGVIVLDGKEVKIPSPFSASKLGINVVCQEYNLAPNLTVLDNIILGKEPVGKFGRIEKNIARERLEEIINKYALHIDLNKFAADLSAAEAKIAEILKAYISKLEILILDEPTAALTEDDVVSLFRLISILKSRGITIIYISHRLDEVFQICDRVSVLKDGNYIDTFKVSDIDHDSLVKLMVGRELKKLFPASNVEKINQKDFVLSLKNLTDSKNFYDVSFDLHEGEIFGIGGMAGQGQREFIRSLFGAQLLTGGEITFKNNKLAINNPKQAVKNSFAFLSDDRRNEGLALTQSILRNISYPSQDKRANYGVIDKQKDKAVVSKYIQDLSIKITSLYQNVQGLSGGNQQRIVIAKWLLVSPQIMLFHEPTLGIDVGAKQDIYKLLRLFAEQGISIIMVTSDMLELLHMSDRICVFYEGRIQAIISNKEATEEKIMKAASGKSINEK
jgi:ribose transport system ATP-binding protein